MSLLGSGTYGENFACNLFSSNIKKLFIREYYNAEKCVYQNEIREWATVL